MGQRSKNHLTLAKEKKEDKMGWQKGQALGWPLSRQVALLAQDLLPFGTGGRGAQKSSSPSPTPFDPLLTRCVEGLYQVPLVIKESGLPGDISSNPSLVIMTWGDSLHVFGGSNHLCLD